MRHLPIILALLLGLLLPLRSHAGLLFDGIDDSIGFGNLVAYDFSDTSFTVALWFKSTSATTQYLLARRIGASGSTGGWFLRLNSDGTLNARIMDQNNTAAGQRNSTTATLANGQWHHVAVIFTTDTVTLANNDVTIFIDGTQDQGARSDSGVGPYLACVGTCPLNTGALSDFSGDFLAGAVENIQIYPNALSAGEIETLGKSHLMHPALTRSPTALWRVDECGDGVAGNGSTVVDRSAGAHPGTIDDGGNNTGATCRASETLSAAWGAH